MKLEKEALLAIIESALFLLGAIFFLLVFMIPSNPIWALVAGIIFGLAGALTWSYPYFVRLFRKMKGTTLSAEEVAKKINEDTDADSYELHRTESYATLTDEFVATPSTSVTPQPPEQPNT